MARNQNAKLSFRVLLLRFLVGIVLWKEEPALAFQKQTLFQRYLIPTKKSSEIISIITTCACTDENNDSTQHIHNTEKRTTLPKILRHLTPPSIGLQLSTAVASAMIFVSTLAMPLIIEWDPSLPQASTPHAVPSLSIKLLNSHAVDPLTANQRFVSDVWFAVTAQFFDPTFNGMGEEGWKSQKEQAIAAVANLGSKDRTKVDAAIDTMLTSLGDPYTRYLPPDQFEALTSYARGGSTTSNPSAGIGVQLILDPKSQGGGSVMVMNTVKDGPAALGSGGGGIRVGDLVLEVDGISMKDATAELVAAKCRGEEGSRVTLVVQHGREGGAKEKISLTRALTAKSSSVDASTFVSEYSGVPVGLLRVSSFTQNTATEIANGMREILVKKNSGGMSSDDVAAIAIDLRGNVGGYMPAGIDAARKFLPARAAVVAEINSAGSGTYYFGDGIGADTAIPLFVIVDERTASAAEIFTAALKDNRRATIVGPTKTFGKGRIQNLQSLEDGSGISVTRARYITPRGRDIHGVGINPNKLSESCVPEASAATCLYGLI